MKQEYTREKYNRSDKMEFWDIYDINKRPTGRTMKRNDWCLKDGEYHLTVLGVVARPDGTFLITKRVLTSLGTRLVGGFRWCSTGRGIFL